jgi:hypothetical protein
MQLDIPVEFHDESSQTQMLVLATCQNQEFVVVVLVVVLVVEAVAVVETLIAHGQMIVQRLSVLQG